MAKKIILSLLILILAGGLGFFIYKSEYKLNPNFGQEGPFFQSRQFKLGLDLSGGSHLVYEADVSALPAGEVDDSMSALRDVIERRVNLFGVSEPLVQTQGGSFVSGGEHKLIVDLPGVTDVDQAIEMIGQTPLLEFKTEKAVDENTPQEVTVDENGQLVLNLDDQFVATDLTGRYLKKASLQFDQTTRMPVISLEFDSTGADLFAEITKNNVGKIVAIYLDGAPLSTPVVQEEITGGSAVISGDFTPEEAKQLVGRLNSGALPVPITLLSKQTIGATLGENAIDAGVKSAIIGFLAIAIFLLFWYRLPGLVATLALSIYVLVVLSLFKLIPVTLTSAGIAGFIISLGIAVDANVLIFERVKEEMRGGRTIADAVANGFSRAWFSIRDANISTLIIATILFWFGTPLIQGFALTLGIGVLVSMLSAIVITKVFLSSLSFVKENKFTRFLFSSGVSK